MPYPYLATVLNCVFWVLYGLPFVTPDSTLVVTINSFGLAIELLYLFIYVLYADNKGRVRVHFFTILATALRTVSTYIYIDGLICCFRKQLGLFSWVRSFLVVPLEEESLLVFINTKQDLLPLGSSVTFSTLTCMCRRCPSWYVSFSFESQQLLEQLVSCM